MAEDLPPPYSPPTGGAVAFSPDLYTAHLASHLATLAARLRASQAEQLSQRARSDLDLVTLLVPHVEAFLSDLASGGAASPAPGPGAARRRPPAELTLVPERAVPRAWSLSGARERRREGEVVQLVRVAAPPAEKGGRPAGGGGGGGGVGDVMKGAEAPPPPPPPPSSSLRERVSVTFDEWGRWEEEDGGAGGGRCEPDPSSLWWWRDEAAARRLAAYLQPRPAAPVERREVRAAVERAREEKKSKGWGLGLGWGRKASTGGSGTKASPSPSPAPASPTAGATESDDDGVTMTVRPEEVTFRRENEFGVWESMSGWGIVVTVRIR